MVAVDNQLSTATMQKLTRALLACDDSGRYDSLYGLPHLDIRVGSYDEAIAFGIREMVVYRVVLPRWGQERKLSDG